MNIPKVSICCITYNHENYIRQCLDGFIMQMTNFTYEILVHDDASTDSNVDIIREYEIKYPHLFKCVYQTTNQFAIQNTLINILFKMAKGKYIALCEGDDYWTDPLKLQKQVDFLEANDDYVICGGLSVNSKTKNYVHLPEEIKVDMTVEDFIYNSPIVTSTVLFKAKYSYNLEKFTSKHFHVDWIIWLYLMLSKGPSSKARYILEPFSVYRIHDKGVFSSLNKIDNHKFYKNALRSSSLVLNLFDKNLFDNHKQNIAKKISWHSVQIFRILIENRNILKAFFVFLSITFSKYGFRKSLVLFNEFKSVLRN